MSHRPARAGHGHGRQESRPERFEWLLERAEKFHEVFPPIVKALELPEGDGEDEPEKPDESS